MDSEIPEPRSYQEELLITAKKKNSLVCLGTGAGKTFIAIMLISDRSHELEPPYDEGGKRTFFLVPSRPLVRQQALEIVKKSRFADADVGQYTGDMNLDYWSKEVWLEHLRAKKIFVMTRQIFLNMLNSAILPLNKVNVLIFDECHHAAPKSKKKNKENKDVYNQIMQYIHSRSEAEHPHILGLSASLINANISGHTLRETISALEQTYKSTCTSVTDLDEVRKHATDPEECIWEYEYDESGFKCDQVDELTLSSINIFSELERYKAKIDKQNQRSPVEETNNQASTSIVVDLPIGADAFKKCHNTIQYILWSMGPWCAIEACDFYIQEFETYINLYGNSYPAFSSILTTVNELLKTVAGLIKYNFHLDHVLFDDILLKFTSNQMKRLLDLLRNYKNPLDSLAGIIFVKQRAICKAMCKFLQKVKEIDEDFKFLKTDYMVGEAARPGFANKIAVKAAQLQKETLNKFRSCDINLLVATSILEEGLDVSQCNLVVRYDGVESYREWVQSQGRARSKNSRFVIFSKATTVTETKETLLKFKDISKRLQLECQTVNRTYRPTSSVARTLPDDEKPLIHPISGARVTLDTAKTIVFMYCNRLPSDAFFSTQPYEIIEENKDAFRFSIRLPINSPFKEDIKGPLKQSEAIASKSAYLKVCRILREHDEIDDSFVPYSKKARLKKIMEEFNLTLSIDENGEKSSDGRKAGTVKRRQIYSKSFGNLFANLPIKASIPTCLYSITVEPRTGEKSIGFICSQHVPLNNIVASFPVYIKSAEFKISVTAVDTKFNLSQDQLSQAQLFHQVVFHESVGFKRKQITFNGTSPVYVVPLNDKFGVDWDMIRVTVERDNINKMSIRNEEERKQFIFNANDYKDAMVYRCYDPNGLFEVLEVNKSITPNSKFPTNNHGYDTYKFYYSVKYGLEIINTTYPFLSVVPIGYNCSAKRLDSTTPERKPINLVPELLMIFPIPTSFHRQCRLLPGIFYRLCQVFNVDKLRERIASEANFGWKLLPPDCSWGILNFDCDKSHCRYGNVNEKNCNLIESDTDDDGDDCEASNVCLDSNKMEIESSSILNNDNLKAVPPNKMDFDTFTTKRMKREPRVDQISRLTSDFYGDTNELKRKFYDFNVEAYVSSMKEKLFKHYDELLQSSQFQCELDNHSQYLPLSSATRKRIDVDFNRVKSFDRHIDEHSTIGPTPSLLLQALTTRNAGDMFNMERLETLGDSFLKLTTSAYLYWKLPMLNEGYLSILKVHQISNFNLYLLGKKKRFGEYMVAQQFESINSWLPPGYGVENSAMETDGETHNKFTEHTISDKSVADCCEALIGAYLVSSGPKGAVKFMTWLGIQITDTPQQNDEHWLQSPKSGRATDSGLDSEIKIRNLYSTLTEFEKSIGHSFRDKCFLIQAMTHVSYHDNTVTDCYQRLEFLGDAVLDYLITRYIYEDPKQFSPGDLTNLRAALTNNSFFGSLAVKHNFHVNLKMNSYELYRSIHSFADKFKKADTEVFYGNFMQWLDERETNSLDETEIPKALGDVFEAVAGAIYLDSNYSLDAVWRVYYPLMKLELDAFRETIPKSPLSLLYMKFPMSVIFSKATAVNRNQVSVTVTIKHGGGTFSEDGFGKNRYWARDPQRSVP